MGKEKKVNRRVKKLRKIISKGVQEHKYEVALEAIATCAELFYHWNQSFTDDELEMALDKIQSDILVSSLKKQDVDAKTILFYDGFGEDNRGLMLIYMDAFISLGYHVVYVTASSAMNKQPMLFKLIQSKDVLLEYISFSTKYISSVEELNRLFIKHHPAKAFLYTFPHDVVGVSVFDHYKGIVERFQINLTDHAFWLGKDAFDYCLEFRSFGANISRVYRGIEREKLLKLPFYPYIDQTISFAGFPFNEGKHKVVFSGGGLYKTFDAEKTYYKLVKSILEYDPSVIFLYAGFGDDSELRSLMEIFAGRVWHIQERKDLFQIMQHIYFYLNTYPLTGALMTQYAALAGKIPITIGSEERFREILLDKENCKILFENKEDALEEIYRLLDDKDYAEQQGKKLRENVIGKGEFENALETIISMHVSLYDVKEEEPEVNSFLQEFAFGFSIKHLNAIIIKDEHWELRKKFPILFFRKRARNLKNLLIKSLKKKGMHDF